jgi:hypothetical protein
MLLPLAQPTLHDRPQSPAGLGGYFGARTDDLAQRAESVETGFAHQFLEDEGNDR